MYMFCIIYPYKLQITNVVKVGMFGGMCKQIYGTGTVCALQSYGELVGILLAYIWI
jgi:hypothetical protein